MRNIFKPCTLAVALCLALVPLASLHAQVVSGSVSGVVTDGQGAAIPGAKVTLVDQLQTTSRTIGSSAEGTFNFTPVLASTYTLVIESTGFKKYERKNIAVHPADQLQLPDLKLEIGTITETLTVEASAVSLKTETVQLDTVLTGDQATDLPIVDRGFLGLLQVIPGYASGDQYSANINGNRSDNMSIKLDGMTNMDSGVNTCCATWVNPDTIAEMKVATNAQSASIGHAGGASVMVVTKSGSQTFHGSGYGFLRNESLNSNTWMNNYNSRPKSTYRYNTYGFTVGGPIFIPKTWNVAKNKLFFFASEERKNQKLGGALNTKTVPTAAERLGDYSTAKDNNGNPLIIYDPLINNGANGGNKVPLPGNLIPASRMSKDGQGLLNIMPLPNYTGPNVNQYNYISQVPYSQPELIGTYKFDYNVNDAWRTWVRYTRDYYTQDNPYGMGGSFPTMGTNETTRHAMGLAVGITTVLTPTLTNEAVFGGSQNLIPQQPINVTYTRTNMGLTYQNLYPNAAQADIGPVASFGGSFISNAPGMGNGIPYYANNTNFSITDNVAKVWPRHTLKFGVSIERDRKDQTSGNPLGNINFGQDNNNTINDSGYSFSNALLGVYDTYSQLDQQRFGRYYFTNAEFYVEDTWKVSRKLTVIPGLRVSFMQPIYDVKGQSGDFVPSLYDPKQAVRLYTHAANPANGNKVMAYDPVTKTFLPSVYYGSVVAGSGNPLNGIVLGGTNGIPKGLVNNRGPQWGPRLGIAYQLDSKTVIRAGGGISYDRLQGNVIYGDLSIPPTTQTRTAYYGFLNQLSTVGGAALFSPPSPGNNGAGMAQDGHVPTVYSWNFTVERELPFQTVLSAAYVGNVNRHLMQLVNVNDPGWGSAWAPANQDPTANGGVGKNDGTTTISTNFFRPFVGIDRWNLMEWGGSANYNSLQMTATHRMTRKLTFTAAYTFSKALGTADSIYNAGAIPGLNRQGNYGRLSYDRTQSLVASYTYWLPKGIRGGNIAVNNFVTRAIVNDWQFSGITTLRSGSPTAISYGINGWNTTMITTGDPDYGARPVFTSNPISSNRNLLQWFNTGSFVAAPKGSHGIDSGIGYLEGPGQNNFDLVLQKNMPFSKDGKRYVQFRLEAYNAFNKTQWSGINTGATLGGGSTIAAALANSTIINLPTAVAAQGPTPNTNGGVFGFGAANAVRSNGGANRVMQLGLKLYF
jgi:Carboxypeptidase regulatory-like domain